MINYSELGYHIVNKSSENNPERLNKIKTNLERFNIPKVVAEREFESLDQSILNKNMDGFFSYEELINQFATDICGYEIDLIENLFSLHADKGIPDPPKLYGIKLSPGWSQYDKNGKFISKVNFPDEEILVFDTETYVLGGNFPIIGTAIGREHSYIWIATEFIYKEVEREDYDQYDLIPLPKTKVIIGHNINFDLCRVRDSYELPARIKSLDTLSMHVVSNGLCSQQRYYSLLEQKNPDELTWKEKAILKNPPSWLQFGTTNSLVAVYNHHVAKEQSFFGDSLPSLSNDDKEIRDVFVKTETMEDFVNFGNFRYELLTYACNDTYYTARVFLKLYPKYKETKSSKIALSGHLLMSTARVPLSEDWDEWLENCENLLNNLNYEASGILKGECHELYKQWISGSITKDLIADDFFLSQLDWTIKRVKVDKNYSSYSREKINSLQVPPHLIDYYEEHGDKLFKGNYEYVPKWYYNIFKKPDIIISPKTEISHLLLRLHYDGKPLFKHKKKGWGHILGAEKTFVRVNSYGTPGENVGSLLAKSYIDDIKNGVLTGEHPKAKRIFEIAVQTSFWISTRSRVLERFYKVSTTPIGTKVKLMCPQPLVHGTISGRQTENLFLVLSSTKYDKLGSEAKSKIMAPEGYKIVNADFDSQELVIASLYGDRESGGILGGCPLTFRTLNGTKEEFTDIHSATAYDLFIKSKGYKLINGEWFVETEE